uniref:39S ribosomal protein L37, mitochondrial n=1 Tax=Panagrellus redivivus TaxID=6233 RepID=A0A7E4V623_PANRE
MVYRKYREIKQWGKINTKLYKRAAKAYNKIPLPKFEVPEAVKAAGVVVHNPNDPSFWKQFEASKPLPEGALHPALAAPVIQTHPLYNTTPAYVFESFEPFSDGVDQACNLINAVKIEGLPKAVTEVQHNLLRNTAEEDVRDCILQGERYDPTLEKLERRHDKILFWVSHPVLHGTPVLKRNNIILEALYRKVLLAAVKEGQLNGLRSDRDQYISATLTTGRFAEAPLIIRGQPHLVVQADKPLVPWAKPDEIEASKGQTVPSVAPIDPLIDLSLSNLYNGTALVPRANIPGLFIDTLLTTRQQSQKYPWTTEQNAANAIVQCFGAALAQATRNLRRDKIAELGELKEPVVAKTVQLVDGRLDLVAVQLNNLNLEAGNGEAKNFVWYEKGLRLYKPKPFWENMDTVEELNMDAFHQFVALLLKR